MNLSAAEVDSLHATLIDSAMRIGLTYACTCGEVRGQFTRRRDLGPIERDERGKATREDRGFTSRSVDKAKCRKCGAPSRAKEEPGSP